MKKKIFILEYRKNEEQRNLYIPKSIARLLCITIDDILYYYIHQDEIILSTSAKTNRFIKKQGGIRYSAYRTLSIPLGLEKSLNEQMYRQRIFASWEEGKLILMKTPPHCFFCNSTVKKLYEYENITLCTLCTKLNNNLSVNRIHESKKIKTADLSEIQKQKLKIELSDKSYQAALYIIEKLLLELEEKEEISVKSAELLRIYQEALTDSVTEYFFKSSGME